MATACWHRCEALSDDLVVPLRDAVERCVADADGDNDEIAKSVRAVYREWKTQHIDEHLDDVLRAAHGRGVLAAVTPGHRCRWMVDPSGPACPDCEDNALAGAVAAGSRSRPATVARRPTTGAAACSR